MAGTVINGVNSKARASFPLTTSTCWVLCRSRGRSCRLSVRLVVCTARTRALQRVELPGRSTALLHACMPHPHWPTAPQYWPCSPRQKSTCTLRFTKDLFEAQLEYSSNCCPVTLENVLFLLKATLSATICPRGIFLNTVIRCMEGHLMCDQVIR